MFLGTKGPCRPRSLRHSKFGAEKKKQGSPKRGKRGNRKRRLKKLPYVMTIAPKKRKDTLLIGGPRGQCISAPRK